MSNPKRNVLFGELHGEFAERLKGDRWQPDVDVFETERGVVVRAEIAGIRSEHLRVTVDGQLLRISGVRDASEPSDVVRLHQMEIASGPFERRVRIPIVFDRDKVTAHLAEGFLTIDLPRRSASQRTVKIER